MEEEKHNIISLVQLFPLDFEVPCLSQAEIPLPKLHSQLFLDFQLGAHIITLHTLSGVSQGLQLLSHGRLEQQHPSSL